MILSRILWVEKYGAKRFSFDRYAIHSGNLSQFNRNFANPCIPPTDISRVSCLCDNYIRGVHGTRREGKTLYRGRACENAVRDSATRRSRKCAFLFFFLKRENNSLFSFSGKIDEEDFFDGRKFF